MSTIRVNNVFDASGGTTSLQVGGGPPARMTLATSQASTSGTVIDFTGIPSWAKRVTVMFSGVSTNGSSSYLVRLGISSGFELTGYVSHAAFIQASSVGSATSTAGFILTSPVAADLLSGFVTYTSPASNTWLESGTLLMDSTTDYTTMVSGSKTLSGTLDRIRITTVNGTDTFDAGSINILYEG